MAKTTAKKSIHSNIYNLNPAHAKALIESLTPRERQVAELIALGVAQKDIAKKLGISTKTLDIFRGNVRTKLDVTTYGIPRIWFCAVSA
ncbi:MAG TPA: LuxR C-terminal-related transcriptional regulator [Gemmataceae bacterium]|nr:LuxR C-terminal-related transcriptional regulator [Gemmataceae bacterium]